LSQCDVLNSTRHNVGGQERLVASDVGDKQAEDCIAIGLLASSPASRPVSVQAADFERQVLGGSRQLRQQFAVPNLFRGNGVERHEHACGAGLDGRPISCASEG
jgi:hypothetical protein